MVFYNNLLSLANDFHPIQQQMESHNIVLPTLDQLSSMPHYAPIHVLSHSHSHDLLNL